MKEELFGTSVFEKENKNSIIYILDSDSMFDYTEYQIMRNQIQEELIACNRMKFNGKTALVYLTNDCLPLEAAINSGGENAADPILYNVMLAFENVEKTGFLNVDSIDFRLNRIFADNAFRKIRLIYLPLAQRISTEDDYEAKKRFRGMLSQMVEGMDNLAAEEKRRLLSILRDETLTSFRLIAEKIKNGSASPSGHMGERPLWEPVLCSADGQLQMKISKDAFIIGKNSAKSDGVIPNDPTISRQHCRFLSSGGSVFLEDMQSLNGTFVNGKRLASGERAQVFTGDVIRIASADFILKDGLTWKDR